MSLRFLSQSGCHQGSRENESSGTLTAVALTATSRGRPGFRDTGALGIIGGFQGFKTFRKEWSCQGPLDDVS